MASPLAAASHEETSMFMRGQGPSPPSRAATVRMSAGEPRRRAGRASVEQAGQWALGDLVARVPEVAVALTEGAQDRRVELVAAEL